MTITEVFDKSPSYPLLRRPYLIAECGVNHEGSLDLALELVRLAAHGGADAVKFQAYRAETLAVTDSPAYWDLREEPTLSQRELFAKYDLLGDDDYRRLKEECDKCGVDFLLTPFDLHFIELAGELCLAIKIASADITCKPLVEAVAQQGKPILLSTGAATSEEVEDAIVWTHALPLVLSHCVLNYPTKDINANLKYIPAMKERWPQYWMGYSDHTLPGGMEALEAAWLLGAVVLEKHFTHDKYLRGNDHYHAMDWHDIEDFRKWTDRVLRMSQVEDLTSQAPAIQHARRSLVTAGVLPAGHRIDYDDLTWKRPGHGISPKSVDIVVGMITSGSLAADQVLQWENLVMEVKHG